MTDPDALDERLRAVERTLTDGDADLTDLRDAAELTREIESLAARLDDVEDRADELDAATQALRGYVGNVRAVNEAVERRADAALAKAETLEEAESNPAPTNTCDCERRRPELSEASNDSEFDGFETEANDSESDNETDGLLAHLAGVLS